MKDIESSGARQILPLVGIVALLVILWFVWSISEKPATPPAPADQAQTEGAAPASPPAPAAPAPAPETPAAPAPSAVTSQDTLPAQRVYDVIDAAQLVEIMQAMGYKAEVDDEDVSWQVEGRNALVLTYDNGHAIQFYVGIAGAKTSLSDLNAWNRGKRYSRTYLDDDGDPCIELDLDLSGGVTRARIEDYFKTCVVSLKQWDKTVIRGK